MRVLDWLPWWVGAMLVSIFLHGPVPLYSTRTLAVAWDMWRLNEWLVPHLNGAPYSHKTPLLYWLYHAGWAVGGVNDIWPRIVHVLIALTFVALTVQLGRRLTPTRDERAASLGAWLLLGMAFVFLYALQLMFDVLLGVCVLAALLALVRDGVARPRPNWPAFALALTAGLLTKGPVMLLHVTPVVVLAPWWSAQVRAQPAAWYARAALALGAACALFALWLIPAAMQGGEAYRSELLWTQTSGRIVQSFDHARPIYWYFIAAPLILFPWLFWPRLWRAIVGLRGEHDVGLRFLGAWLLPVFVAFCVVSGKQAYYLVPELAGAALLLAMALSRLPAPARPIPLWGFGVLLMAFGLLIGLLPYWAEHHALKGHWLIDVASSDVRWGYGIAAVGALLLLRARTIEVATRRIALASLAFAALAHAQFTDSLWHDYNVTPTALRLAELERAGHPIANIGAYQGQFHFAGRLTRPIESLRYTDAGRWATQHPNGVIVQYPDEVDARAHGRPFLIQPFRSDWIELWNADDWRRAHPEVPADRVLDPAPHAVEIVPPDYERAELPDE